MTEFRVLLLSTSLIVGLASANGCGRTDLDAPSNPNTGSTGGVATGGNGGSVSGVCSEVPCLASLVLGCEPSGSCTTQSNITGPSSSELHCYSNGVKQQRVDGDLSETLTIKRDSQICFSVEGSRDSIYASGFSSYVFRNQSGKQIATGPYAFKSGPMVVACSDGNSAPLGSACSDAVGLTATCSPAVCTF